MVNIIYVLLVTIHIYILTINVLNLMKVMLIIVFAFLLCFIFLTGQAQTIYGVTGSIKIPDAYTVESGKCMMGVAYIKDYYYPDKLREQWGIFVNIGFHSRLELGGRLGVFPDLSPDSPIYGVRFDRILSGKFVLVKEKDRFPQIACGMQDITGTRFHNSTYLVASKYIPVKELFGIQLNVGYGTKLNDLILGDAANHNFIGFFGGAEFGFKKRIYLLAEYDALDINAGLKIIPKDWLSFYFSMFKMEVPLGGFFLKFKI
jgi:hypothetical protein